MIIGTMMMMVMVIMAYHRFFWGLGDCREFVFISDAIFTPFSFCHFLTTISVFLPLYLYHFASLSSTRAVFCIAFFFFFKRSTALFPDNKTIKSDEIPQKLIVKRQDVNLLQILVYPR